MCLRVRWLHWGLVCLLIFSASSCDRTALSGKIVVEKEDLRIGETIQLKLEVPEELKGIHRVHWDVEPEDAGLFEVKDDRTASFTAQTAGECDITTWGFYKQTNPQFITKVKLSIRN